MPEFSNWGRYPRVAGSLESFKSDEELISILSSNSPMICRGMGRSYGDASLQERMVSTSRFNRILAFDPDSGIVDCESGVSLGDLLDVFLPRGWFLQVTPGTREVSVGGAIAADVHGKNHHLHGSFCQYVTSLELCLASGEVIHCSQKENRDYFELTCGGMGLTGVILRAGLAFRPVETAWILQEIIPASNYEELMQLCLDSCSTTYSVAWMDCLSQGRNLGRGILIKGEHCSRGDLLGTGLQPFSHSRLGSWSLPFAMPSWFLNHYSVKTFNSLYYHLHFATKDPVWVDYSSFFYPLDKVKNWNRIYGKSGFTQYQFVVPLKTARDCFSKVLRLISAQNLGPFLGVLKLFGEQRTGVLSFPMQGFTLALDFPVCSAVLSLLDQLDKVVCEAGGRIYLAKDARMKPEVFKTSYPTLPRFIDGKSKVDPHGLFQSLLWQRLKCG
jgi:decaprenylphospho-beta-D-ribofuranose 2-oxidase